MTLRVRQSLWSMIGACVVSLLPTLFVLMRHEFHGGFRRAAMTFLGTYLLLMVLSLWMAVRYIVPQVRSMLCAPVSLDKLMKSIE